MSNTKPIPPNLHDLLVKLKVLGMIKRGTKINMSTLTFTDANSWYGAFQRSIDGEDRKNLMIHLKHIIEQSINALGEYQNTEFFKLIISNLAEAKIGIQNLSITYQSDPSIVAQIAVFISNIDLQLSMNPI